MTTRTTSSPQSPVRLLGLAAAVLIGYVLIYFLLYPVVGPMIGALAVLPVMALGWYAGWRLGLLAAAVMIALTVLLQAAHTPLDLAAFARTLPGYLALVLVGGVAGYLHSLSQRLRGELAQRQQAEAALAANEARLIALLAHSVEGLALIAADRTITFVSPAVAKILGGKAEDWVGRDFMARVHPDDTARITAKWPSLLAQPRGAVTTQLRYKHTDNTWRWLEVTATNSLDDPTVRAVVVNFHDVTERRQTDEALTQAERKYRSMVEQMPAILYMSALDISGRKLYNSPQIARLGYTVAEYDADPELWRRNIHPDDKARVLAGLDQMRATGQPFVAEYRVLHPSGQIMWVQDEAVIVRDEAGQPLYRQGVVVDITARKQAEAAVSANEARLAALIEHSGEGIALITADGTITYTSPAAQRILGAPADYWLTGNFFNRLHPDDRTAVQGVWVQALAQPQSEATTEFRYQRYDGQWIWLEVSGTNWLDDPAVQAVVVNYRDVTERHNTQSALEQAERKYRTMVEQLPAILYMAALDDSGGSLYNSPQVIKLGYPATAYDADPGLWRRNIHPDDQPRFEAQIAQMKATGTPLFAEYRVLHPWGEVRWVQDEAVIVYDEAGQPLFRQGVVVDITARKQAEAALAVSEQRFRGLIEHAPDAITLLNAAGQISYVSPATQRVLGYDPAQMVGGDLAALVHPDDRPMLVLRLNQLRQQPDQTITLQFRVRHQDGGWHWLESNITNLLAEPSVAALVFNYRDITERRQRDSELEALVGVGAALREATTRDEMQTAVLAQVTAVLNTDGAALDYKDTLTNEVVQAAGVGRWTNSIGGRVKEGEGITALVMASGLPYVIAEVSTDKRFAKREFLRGMRALAGVPLIARQDTIGILWATRDQEFTPSEVRLLMAMAEAAASAIHRVMLLESTEQGLTRLTALRTIERAISNSLDVRLTLHILLEQIAGVLQVDAAAVLLLDSETQTLSVAYSRGLTVNSRSRPEVRLGQGRAGRVALERQRLEVLNLAASPDPGDGTHLTSEGFRSYIGLPLISKGEVQGVLEIYQRTPLAPTNDWLVFLEALAGQAAIAIDNAQLFTNLQDSNMQLRLAYDATIEGWSAALDLRDRETEGHSQRVTDLTLILAQALGVGGEELVHIRRGALLHDIGKMAVPDHILLKTSKLNDEEWASMRRHPRTAYELLTRITYLRPALDIPYCHHEKWDGSGYPRGLKGLQIPLAARIFMLADVWDALRSTRPYREPWSRERTRAHLESEIGTHFDPDIARVFLDMEQNGSFDAVAKAYG